MELTGSKHDMAGTSRVGAAVRGDPGAGLVREPAGELTVSLRPARTDEERLALEAAFDTLIAMALRKIVEEREYKKAVERGKK
jgi:hypothetical protein